MEDCTFFRSFAPEYFNNLRHTMMIEALLATAPLPIPLTVGDCTFRMIPVPAGAFDMGDEQSQYDDERPVHPVRLDAFWMGQFPVTQALWRAVAERAGTLDPDPAYFKGAQRPVEEVSWEDVQVFLDKLNELLPGRHFRLPTEAEWEYAARGGRSGGPQYAGSDRLEAVAWWDENSHGETKPVGLKLPNALGLFDMSGNVWEWCEDWHDSNFYAVCAAKGEELNPRNDEKGSYRVLRGGSWLGSNPQGCRVATRVSYDPTNRNRHNGFRLAATPSSSVARP